ncbi:MAG: 3'-5' exoribonuclease YhaM family protein [Planctomycetota bacterium]
MPVLKLDQMLVGEEADVFALLSAKEELQAKNGKPYYRVAFRDDTRELTFPIWADSPWAADCRERWTPGSFYKLRAILRESNFGPQLEIRKIRETVDADSADGFDPAMCLPRSRFDPQQMFDQLLALVREKISQGELRRFVEGILEQHRAELLVHPAARRNHHAFTGGLLEHTLSVARTCAYLAEKYAAYYADMQPPLDVGLVVAGGVLHDIGKLRELAYRPEGAERSAEGALIGHLLEGRDMVREAAERWPLPGDLQLRLEHILIAHQRLPEWGSPKPPMTPEALLVHYADDVDAKFCMMAAVLKDDRTAGPVTSGKNVLMQQVYRGSEG